MNHVHGVRSFFRGLRRVAFLTCCVVASLLTTRVPLAEQHDQQHVVTPQHTAGALKLGTVHFPNTGAASAQEPFLRGVALLHSFEYLDAGEAFRAAQRADLKFALAYWCEALTHSQFLWGVEDLPAARAVLARLAPTRQARLTKAGSARERAFGAAAEAFIAEGEPLERARAYADAMRAYATAAPKDLEGLAFASHAAMVGGLSAPAAEAVRRFEDAIAFAERVFTVNPDHPGGAHYLIHATDSPRFAARGLAAARAYAEIAPDADHALHMPSHIFLQLGMWDDVVASNERSWPASKAWVASRGLSATELSWHSLIWLQYGYLQQGRFAAARALIDSARALLDGVALETSYPDAKYVVSTLAYQYGVETGRWDEYPIDDRGAPEALGGGTQLSIRAAMMAGGAAYQSALAVIRGKNDTARAQRTARALGVEAEHLAPGGRKAALERMASQLDGFIASARGDRDRAVMSFARASENEQSQQSGIAPVGPPTMIPPSEALGAALLEAGRAREAAVAYEGALATRPNRSASWLGLARAKLAVGDRTGAADAYSKLLANWRLADPDLPALVEARAAAKAASRR